LGGPKKRGGGKHLTGKFIGGLKFRGFWRFQNNLNGRGDKRGGGAPLHTQGPQKNPFWFFFTFFFFFFLFVFFFSGKNVPIFKKGKRGFLVGGGGLFFGGGGPLFLKKIGVGFS